MKVLFKNRFDCFTTPGGDTTQMLKTKQYLERLGVSIDVSLSPNDSMKDYDVIHVFNLMRPLEATLAIKEAKRLNKKVVFSSIYWDFSEYNLVGRNSSIHFVLNKLLSEFHVEKLKDVIRGRRGIVSYSDFFGYLLSNFKNTLESVDLFLPNSKNEGDMVKQRVLKSSQVHVVNNAVDKDIFFLINRGIREKKMLISCRLDPRKNILNLVKAVKSYPLDIYGSATPSHLKYEQQISAVRGKNVTMKGFVDSKLLCDIYNEYALHIMPSWLETPGLSQLEAAACGCNIVSTNRGSTSEYFENKATYCEPGSLHSIRDAVEQCFDQLHKPNDMSEFILDQYTWDKTAHQTLSAYEKVLVG